MVSLRFISIALAVATSATAAPLNLNTRDLSKRGAAYNDASLVAALLSGKTVTWAYNWNSEANGQLPEGVMYIPMLWGTKMLDGWSSAVESALSSGSKYLFGFNEPDIPSQSSMSTSEAASLFRQNITPYADRATLATPAITNSQQGNEGLSWMSQFLDECADCKASIMAIHWYGNSIDDFKKHVDDSLNLAQKKGVKEVWITEFALNDASQAVPFLLQALPWLDARDGVGGYAYFYCAPGYLVDAAKTLSASGKVYTTA